MTLQYLILVPVTVSLTAFTAVLLHAFWKDGK